MPKQVHVGTSNRRIDLNPDGAPLWRVWVEAAKKLGVKQYDYVDAIERRLICLNFDGVHSFYSPPERHLVLHPKWPKAIRDAHVPMNSDWVDDVDASGLSIEAQHAGADPVELWLLVTGRVGSFGLQGDSVEEIMRGFVGSPRFLHIMADLESKMLKSNLFLRECGLEFACHMTSLSEAYPVDVALWLGGEQRRLLTDERVRELEAGRSGEQYDGRRLSEQAQLFAIWFHVILELKGKFDPRTVLINPYIRPLWERTKRQDR
jgi:hypothetical protein